MTIPKVGDKIRLSHFGQQHLKDAFPLSEYTIETINFNVYDGATEHYFTVKERPETWWWTEQFEIVTPVKSKIDWLGSIREACGK